MPDQQTLTIQQAIDLALQHHNAGQLPEAESIYQQILQAEPTQPSALHLLGLIAHQVGKNDIAVELIGKALAIKPDYAEAHYNLGIVFQEQGKLDEATESYRKALIINPDYAEAHNDLGNTFQKQGKLDKAIECYRKALAINPNYADPQNNLGNVFQKQGKADEATKCYRKAIAIKPNYADPHNNLGVVLQEQGKLDGAVASYHRALTINPDFAEVHNNLGLVLQAQGEPSKAFSHHRTAASLTPHNDNYWAALALSVNGVHFSSTDDNLHQDLLFLLKRPAACSPSNVAKPILSALYLNSDFSKLVHQTPGISDAAILLSKIPLFIEIIKLTPVCDLQIEKMLALLRQSMLKDAVAGNVEEASLPFATALALQCFINEYVYPVSEEEVIDVNNLEQRVVTLLDKGEKLPPFILAVLGAYKPLHECPWAKAIQDCEWGDDIIEVVDRQISEPMQEQSLRSQIPNLTPIKDAVSHSVREQYEENPYPRWVKAQLLGNAKSIKDTLQGHPLHFDLGNCEFPEAPKVLIAGCGTGLHSIDTASRFTNAHVLAVDLSLSSLSHALRKTNELGLSNIEYSQADIMELGNMGRQFDVIECSGVLHHLNAPLSGWKVLEGLLRPGGVMRVGLYSEIARHDIIKGRSLIVEKDFSTSPEDIRQCRQDIIGMAEGGHAEMINICNRGDFYSLSACRDMLFHVQEHRFTLPQIEDALKSLNLKFLGFEFDDQNTLRKVRAAYPKKRVLTSLSLWNKFEIKNPDTFRGMYQFWCQKM